MYFYLKREKQQTEPYLELVDTLELSEVEVDVDALVLTLVLTDVDTLVEALELNDLDVEVLVLALEYVE